MHEIYFVKKSSLSFVKSFLNLCQIFVKHFSFSVSSERFLMQPNFNSAPILSNLCQIFAKSLSNLCQIFVKSKSFSRQCYFMQWFFLNILHLRFVEERRLNCVPFANLRITLPSSSMDLKRYSWFYLPNWSNYDVYI